MSVCIVYVSTKLCLVENMFSTYLNILHFIVLSVKCDFNLRLSNAEENPAAVMRTTLTKEQKQNIPQHRYTDRSKRRNNLMKGWDVTGMIRYSELVKIVQTFRLTDAYVHFSKHAVNLLQNRKLQ